MNKNENTNLTAEKIQKNNDAKLVVEIENLAFEMLLIKNSLDCSGEEITHNSNNDCLENIKEQILTKIIKLKKLDKYFGTTESRLDLINVNSVPPIDSVNLWTAVMYGIDSYGKRGKLVKDAKNPNKKFYQITNDVSDEIVPFMWFFNVAFAKKKADVMDAMLEEQDHDNRKAKEALIHMTLHNMAKELNKPYIEAKKQSKPDKAVKEFKLGRITCKVLSRNAVQKFMTEKGFPEEYIQKVLELLTYNLVCSDEAGINEDGEECSNKVSDSSAYNNFGRQEELDNMWCALHEAYAQAETSKKSITMTYIKYLATYFFCKEDRDAQSLKLYLNQLLDKDFTRFLLENPECVYDLKLEDAILAFYNDISGSKKLQRETVQKHIAATRKLLQQALCGGAAKNPIVSNR